MIRCLVVVVILVVFAAPASSVDAADYDPDAEVAAARQLFERNLDAIRNRDREAYLACYLQRDTLARTGAQGFELGYDGLAESTAGGPWPDLFEARDLRLVPVEPGVVYGTYRYRVRYGEVEQSGLSERLFLKTPDGWRIAVTSAFGAPDGAPPPPVALVGATLVDGTGSPPVPDSAVVLESGRIACAGTLEECPVPDNVTVRDVSGHWITPGLVDAHMHFSQTGWADGRPDALDVRDLYPYEEVQASLRAEPERWFRSYLCSGVTAVFDVGGYPWTWELPERAEDDTSAPHVASTGPLLSTWDFWLNLPGERQFVYLEDGDAAREGVGYLVAHDADAVKVWFIPVGDREFGDMEAAVLAAGAAARERRVPLVVHATGLREAKVAVAAGAHMLVHSVWDVEVDDAFLEAAKAQGTVYCPTLVVMGGYKRLGDAALSGQPPEVDDPNRCVDAATLAHVEETARVGADRVDRGRHDARSAAFADYDPIMASNLKRVLDAGIPVVMGTDAGNPLTLHGPSVHGEMEAMQAAGMTPMEVVVASTRGGALAMGRLDDIGTVEAGKIADLLLLAADPTKDAAAFRALRLVVRGGVVRTQEELRAPDPATE